MSIATLKRKTFQGGNSRISPLSGNSNLGFALNGTLRIGPQIGINLGSSSEPFATAKYDLPELSGPVIAILIMLFLLIFVKADARKS